MTVVAFEKWSGAGNDFLLLGSEVAGGVPVPTGWSGPDLARRLCLRRTGVGADGLTWLRPAGGSGDPELAADHWNPDGSRAEFCGNAARCVAAHLLAIPDRPGPARFRLGEVPVQGRVCTDGIEVSVPAPRVLEASVPTGVLSETLGPDQACVRRALWIDSGVPHVVLLLNGPPAFPLDGCGRRLRAHRHFSPRGTNVDLVWPAEAQGPAQGDRPTYRLRTYERGVEGETLACGSGALAAAAAIRAEATAGRQASRGIDTVAAAGAAGEADEPRAIPSRLRLQVRSGDRLDVVVSENAWRLRGPAVRIFEGVAELPDR